MGDAPTDSVLEIIERRLIPNEEAKKARGEVFTPLGLVREMLFGVRKNAPTETWGIDANGNLFDDPAERVGGIPLAVWRDHESKWLDPANGIGNFPYIAFQMLDYQLKHHGAKKVKKLSDEERRKHIVEKMLFMVELDRGNVNTSFQIFAQLTPGAKPNLCCADTLKLSDADLQREFGTSRFGVVMGNPPFQEPFKSGDNKLYLEFIRFANRVLEPSGFVVFVVPRTALEYLTMSKKRKYVDKRYDIQFLNDSESFLKSRYFPKVGSTFVYFVYQNSDVYESTQVLKLVDKVPTLVSLDIFETESLSPIDQTIVSKIFQDTPAYVFKSFRFSNGKPQRIRETALTKGDVTKSPTATHTVKIIDNYGQTKPFPGIFYYYPEGDVDMAKDKVVFSVSGYLNPTLDTSHEYTYSDNFRYLLCDTLTCEEIRLLFTSPIVDFITKKFKTSGFNDNLFFERLSKLKPVKDIRTVDDIYTQLGVLEHKDYLESHAKKRGGKKQRIRTLRILRRKSRDKTRRVR